MFTLVLAEPGGKPKTRVNIKYMMLTQTRHFPVAVQSVTTFNALDIEKWLHRERVKS